MLLSQLHFNTFLRTGYGPTCSICIYTALTWNIRAYSEIFPVMRVIGTYMETTFTEKYLSLCALYRNTMHTLTKMRRDQKTHVLTRKNYH